MRMICGFFANIGEVAEMKVRKRMVNARFDMVLERDFRLLVKDEKRCEAHSINQI